MVATITVVWMFVIFLSPLFIPLLIPIHHFSTKIRKRRSGTHRNRNLSNTVIGLGLLSVFLVTFPEPLPFIVEIHYLLFVVLGSVYYYVESFVRIRREGKSPTESFNSTATRTIGVSTSACVEEIFYRGGLSPLLVVIGPIGYVSASAVSFGFAHGLLSDWTEAGYKSLLGVVLASTFVVTGSLVPSILLHLGYNWAYIQRGSAVLDF